MEKIGGATFDTATANPFKAEKASSPKNVYGVGPGNTHKYDDRGLYLPRVSDSQMADFQAGEFADDLPPDEQWRELSSYKMLKPPRPADILGTDLKTESVEVKDTGVEHVGRGLFARKAFKAGEHVFEFDGVKRGEKGYAMSVNAYSTHAIVVGSSGYFLVYAAPMKDSPLRYLNHSCNPNMARKGEDQFGFVAIRDIAPGEELTADYSLLEANPYWTMDGCGCGSAECRHTIGDVSSLPLDTLVDNWERLIPAMQERALRYSRDPEIARQRNRLGAEAMVGSGSPMSVEEIAGTTVKEGISRSPGIVSERNRLGAELLVKSFLDVFRRIEQVPRAA